MNTKEITTYCIKCSKPDTHNGHQWADIRTDIMLNGAPLFMMSSSADLCHECVMKLRDDLRDLVVKYFKGGGKN